MHILKNHINIIYPTESTARRNLGIGKRVCITLNFRSHHAVFFY